MIGQAVVAGAVEVTKLSMAIADKITAARAARRSKAEAITEVYGVPFIKLGLWEGMRVAAGKAGRKLRGRNEPRGQVEKNVYIYLPQWREIDPSYHRALRAFLDDAAKGNNEQAVAVILATNYFGLNK